MSEQTIPASHPELVGWHWKGKRGPFYLFEPTGKDDYADIQHATIQTWLWFGGQTFGYCDTADLARQAAEQAVADWLRSGGK